MTRTLASVALIAFTSQAWAQTSRPRLSPAEARQLETALASNPNDREARSALLGYYFLNSSLDPAVAIPARRRHILWLIGNTPADELARTPASTIDAAGHRLADARGFRMASDAWRAQVAKQDIDVAALVNAAYFFKLSDKGFTISLLERAIAVDPDSKETAARLGDEYALAIMGVTMVNKNGYPMGADPRQTQTATARQAREALKTSENPYVLAKAGYMLSFQGSILYYAGKLAFETAPLAETTLQRAVSLAPGDPDVASYLEQHREIQRDIQRQVQAASAAPSER